MRKRRAPTDAELMVSYLAELVPRLRRERLEIQKVEVVKSEPPVIEFDGYLYLGDVIWGIGGQVSSRQADGILVISMLRLHALQPADAAITARLIGKLPASLIVRAVVAKLDDENELDSWADALGVPAAPSSRVRARKRRAARSLRDGAPPRGRRGTPREFYDTLADEAVGLAAQGLPVIATLAETRRRPERTVKGWIARARSDEVAALVSRGGAWELGPKHPRVAPR